LRLQRVAKDPGYDLLAVLTLKRVEVTAELIEQLSLCSPHEADEIMDALASWRSAQIRVGSHLGFADASARSGVHTVLPLRAGAGSRDRSISGMRCPAD
jgi:hypothetical protein